MVNQDAPVTSFSSQVKRQVAVSAFKTKFDDTGTYTYVGVAEPGAKVGSASWQIKRITNATGDIEWAGTSVSFNQEWDERANLGYT